MKTHVQILCVVLLALVNSGEAFFLRGRHQGASITASVTATAGGGAMKPSVDSKPKKPAIDPRAVIGYKRTQI